MATKTATVSTTTVTTRSAAATTTTSQQLPSYRQQNSTVVTTQLLTTSPKSAASTTFVRGRTNTDTYMRDHAVRTGAPITKNPVNVAATHVNTAVPKLAVPPPTTTSKWSTTSGPRNTKSPTNVVPTPRRFAVAKPPPIRSTTSRLRTTTTTSPKTLQQRQYVPTTNNNNNNNYIESLYYENIIIMGQFNYAPSNLLNVVTWVNLWETRFKHVIVRGPFAVEQIEELTNNHNVTAKQGRDDRGFVSPIENLMNTLIEYKDHETIQGVLYIHDDAILNLTDVVIDGSGGGHYNIFPTNHIIANTAGHSNSENVDYSYLDPRLPQHDKSELSKVAYRIYPNSTIKSMDGRIAIDYNDKQQLQSFYDNVLRPWMWFPTPNGIPAQVSLARSSAIDPYREPEDFSLFISPMGQADFLFVPTSIAQQFYDVAKLFVEHGVFLECAMSTIVDLVVRRQKQHHNVGVRKIRLCTSWDTTRGTPEMAKHCHREQAPLGQPFGIYHPIKMGRDPQQYIDQFSRLSLPT